MRSGEPGSRLWSCASIAAFVIVALLSVQTMSPPAPAGDDAAAGDFSAARAYDMLARILADERPHPTGSAANSAVRARILAELERIGYQPEVRRRFVCSELWAVCGTVDNVIAHLPGAGTAPGVLLAAHYDSVAAGPGAGDDGAGVAAILEVARALKTGPALPRSVWFLLGDGEEGGLLGAEAFVREPEFASIGSVINLEARGTGGPSQLFETQSGNAAVVSLAGEALANPVGSSLAYEIYKHMPNNTDFTVFRREGLAGANFAFIDGPARYHTPRDDLDHLDLGSLQHQGDNALAMVRALASTNAAPVADHDRVFFDLFGATLVGWPAGWNGALLVLGIVGGVALAVRVARRSELRSLRLLGTCLLLIVLPAAAMMIAVGLQAALDGTDPAGEPWTAQGKMLVFAFMALAVAVCALAARPVERWAGAAALSLGALFVFALVAAATVAYLPGASFIALLPLLAGVLAGHVGPSRPVIWGAVAGLFTGLLWFPFAFSTYGALGFAGLPGVTLLMLLALMPLLPAVARIARSAMLVVGLAAICLAAFVAIALWRPAFTGAVPQSINLLYAAGRDGGRLFTDAVPVGIRPAGLMSAGAFEAEPVKSLPWSDRLRLAGREGPALPTPELQVVRDTPTTEGRRLQLHLRPRRDSRVLYLVLPRSAEPHALRVQQLPVAPGAAASDARWRTIEIIAPPAEGIRIDVELHTREPVTLYAADAADGLPLVLDDVVDARNAAAVPIGNGDRTLAWRELNLPALRTE